jgi:hypothetical protein
MQQNIDLIDLLRALNAEGAKYLIVGAYAFAFHTAIDGVTFEQAWSTRIESIYAGVPVSYIGRNELIANKKAAARPQDLADVNHLESVKDVQK